MDLETSTTTDKVAEGLRAWAQGLHPLVAATELVIRGGFAQPGQPWINPCDTDGWPERAHWHWIDFEQIPNLVGAMSGGERRFMLFAASLSGRATVDVPLGDLVSSVDRNRVDLMLAALAHAAGTHEGRSIVRDPETGALSFSDEHTSLHPWPEGDR